MPNAFPTKRHSKTNKNKFKTKQRQLMKTRKQHDQTEQPKN